MALAEELVFRGYLFYKLLEIKKSRWLAINTDKWRNHIGENPPPFRQSLESNGNPLFFFATLELAMKLAKLLKTPVEEIFELDNL